MAPYRHRNNKISASGGVAAASGGSNGQKSKHQMALRFSL